MRFNQFMTISFFFCKFFFLKKLRSETINKKEKWNQDDWGSKIIMKDYSNEKEKNK
jgi:hypothetical protein